MAATPVFVEPEEELPGVIEHIKRASAQDVPLVLPVGARFGQSRFNFQLLRGYAARLGKRVTIVSSDPTIQRMAHENGFAALAGVEQYGAGYTPPETVDAPAPPPPPSQPPASAPPQEAPLGWSIEADPEPVPTIHPGASQWTPAPPPAPPPSAWSPRVVQAPTRATHALPPRAATRPAYRTRPPHRKMRLTIPTYLVPGDVRPARVVFYGAAALVLLVGIIASIVYMPSAEVDMVAQAQPFSSNVSVSGDPGKQPIPIRVVTASRSASQNFNAGNKVTQPQAAKGTVTLDASDCSGGGFQIPNGTRLRYIAGNIEFATTGGDVNIGGGSPDQATVAVVATQPGQQGNVGAGQYVFENPGAGGCIQINGSQTTGGADGQQKKEIQKTDITNAQNQLEAGLKQQITDQFSKGTRSGEKLLTNQIQWQPQLTTPGHNVGDDVTSFSATLVEQARAYYYRPGDVTRAFTDALKKNAPAAKQVAGDVATSYQVTVSQNDHLSFSGKATGFLAPQLDSDAIRSQAAGRSPSQVKQELKSRYPVQDVQVKQFPFGLPFMPLSASRVTVRYQILRGAVSRPASG